jgi:hypothetical protein
VMRGGFFYTFVRFLYFCTLSILLYAFYATECD